MIYVYDRKTGDPIEGAEVSGGAGGGETGEDGSIDIGPITAFPVSYTVSYQDCEYSGTATSCVDIQLCWCKARVTVDPGPGTLSGDAPGTRTGNTWEVCELIPCGQSSALPTYLGFSSDAEGYLSACWSGLWNCGDDLEIVLSPTFYADCYINGDWLGYSGSFESGCGFCGVNSCNSTHPTIAGADLVPINIIVTFTSPCGEFADDEGRDFTLGPPTDTLSADRTQRNIVWTGNYGNGGNYYGNETGDLNHLGEGSRGGEDVMDTAKVFFDSVTVQVVYQGGCAGFGGSVYTANYIRTKVLPDGSTYTVTSSTVTTPSMPTGIGLCPGPIDSTTLGLGVKCSYYPVRVREVPCGGYGGGSYESLSEGIALNSLEVIPPYVVSYEAPARSSKRQAWKKN